MESWFKPISDGHKVFYPWGNLCKRGYVVGSERDYGRLRRQINLWIGIATVSTIGAFRLQGYLAACATVVVSLAFYFLWMRRVVRKLSPYTAPQSPL